MTELAFRENDLAAWTTGSLVVRTNAGLATLNAPLQIIGKTDKEVTITPETETTEWLDNTTGTQVLHVIDIAKTGITVNFQWMQLVDENSLALALNLDFTAGTPNRLEMGASPSKMREGRWEFEGSGREGRKLKLVIRRGIIIPTEAITIGTPGDYAKVPSTVRALAATVGVADPHDPEPAVPEVLVTDKDNIAFFEIDPFA